MIVSVKVKKLDKRAELPVFGSENAAGADLRSIEPVEIASGETVMIHTGLALEIPAGYAGLIYARSGMAVKKGLAPANKVGVIDSDYRGEIMVALHNHSEMPAGIEAGERIAQIVITQLPSVVYEESEELDETERGSGGFGSTGMK